MPGKSKRGSHARQDDEIGLDELLTRLTERRNALLAWDEIRAAWSDGTLPVFAWRLRYADAAGALEGDARKVVGRDRVQAPPAALRKYELLGLSPQAICDPSKLFLTTAPHAFALVANDTPIGRLLFFFVRRGDAKRLWPGLLPSAPASPLDAPAVPKRRRKPAPAPRKIGRKPRDWEPAKAWLRAQIKARGDALSKREGQMVAVRDELFAPTPPHDRTIFRRVVDPVRKEGQKGEI